MYVISGSKKGRKILTPKRDFRPTQAKVREAFFNIVNIENKTIKMKREMASITN